MTKSILFCGATGKQGSAVVKALLDLDVDIEILALTRNPNKPSAHALSKVSSKVKLMAGNLNDPNDIFRTVHKVSKSSPWGVFSVQPVYIGPGADATLEERQGKGLVDAALDNNVKYFVYSSVDRGGAISDHEPTKIPHFVSKYNIEQYLQEKSKGSDMDWTILRPVAFFENLVPGFMGKVFATNLKNSLKRGKKLQFISTSDIGYVAASCFTSHDRFRNQKLSLAGDELSYAQFKRIFKDTTGQKLPTTLRVITSLLNLAFGELGCMFRWFGEYGYGADIDRIRDMNPRLKDFATWLRDESQYATLKVVTTCEMTKMGSIVVVNDG